MKNYRIHRQSVLNEFLDHGQRAAGEGIQNVIGIGADPCGSPVIFIVIHLSRRILCAADNQHVLLLVVICISEIGICQSRFDLVDVGEGILFLRRIETSLEHRPEHEQQHSERYSRQCREFLEPHGPQQHGNCAESGYHRYDAGSDQNGPEYVRKIEGNIPYSKGDNDCGVEKHEYSRSSEKYREDVLLQVIAVPEIDGIGEYRADDHRVDYH